MNNPYQIQKEIFWRATTHFHKVIQTLFSIEKLDQKTLGLEGWFRIELIKALENTDVLEKICNKGPDIKLSNGEYLELKAAADLNFKYLLRGANECPCLFLGKPRGKCEGYSQKDIEMEFKDRASVDIELEKLDGNWYLGLILNN